MNKKDFINSLDEFKFDSSIQKKIGEGSFANVFKAFHEKSKKNYAIKVIKIFEDEDFQEQFDIIKREIHIH